jgi:PHS family inorganic phosphate transporter-like MFS transporter
MAAAIFFMQGFGQFSTALVSLITTTCFRKSFSTALSVSTCKGDCQLAANSPWRIIIGFGMLLCSFRTLLSLYNPRNTTLYVRRYLESGKG